MAREIVAVDHTDLSTLHTEPNHYTDFYHIPQPEIYLALSVLATRYYVLDIDGQAARWVGDVPTGENRAFRSDTPIIIPDLCEYVRADFLVDPILTDCRAARDLGMTALYFGHSSDELNGDAGPQLKAVENWPQVVTILQNGSRQH